MCLPDIGKSFTRIGIEAHWFDLTENLKKQCVAYNPKQEAVMITDRLAKWLFPRWQPFRRRREIKSLIVALWVGLLVAGAVTGILILINSMSK